MESLSLSIAVPSFLTGPSEIMKALWNLLRWAADMSVVVASVLVILTVCVWLVERMNKKRSRQRSKNSWSQSTTCGNANINNYCGGYQSDNQQHQIGSQQWSSQSSDCYSSQSNAQQMWQQKGQHQPEPQVEYYNDKASQQQSKIMKWAGQMDCNYQPQYYEEPQQSLLSLIPQVFRLMQDPSSKIQEQVQYIRSCGFPSFFLDSWLQAQQQEVFRSIAQIAASVTRVESWEAAEFPNIRLLMDGEIRPQPLDQDWQRIVHKMSASQTHFEVCCKINGLPWYTTPYMQQYDWMVQTNHPNIPNLQVAAQVKVPHLPLLFAPAYGGRVGATWQLCGWYGMNVPGMSMSSPFSLDRPSSLLAYGQPKTTTQSKTASFKQPWQSHTGVGCLRWKICDNLWNAGVHFVPANQVEIVRKGLMGAHGLDGSIINKIASFLDYSNSPKLNLWQEWRQNLQDDFLEQFLLNEPPMGAALFGNPPPVIGGLFGGGAGNQNQRNNDQPLVNGGLFNDNGLFGNQHQVNNNPPPVNGGLFGGGAGGLFGNQNQRNNDQPAVNGGGGLFGNQNQWNNNAAPLGGGLFGGNDWQPRGGGLFGNEQPRGGGLFGNQQPRGGGLFGNQQPRDGGLFGNWQPRDGGLFGNQQPHDDQHQALFGNQPQDNNNAQPQNGGLFGNEQPRIGGGLFGDQPLGNNNGQPVNGGLFAEWQVQGWNNMQPQLMNQGLFGNQPQQQQNRGLFGNNWRQENDNPQPGNGGLLDDNREQPLNGGLFGNDQAQVNNNPQPGVAVGGNGALFGNENQQQVQGGLFENPLPAPRQDANNNNPFVQNAPGMGMRVVAL